MKFPKAKNIVMSLILSNYCFIFYPQNYYKELKKPENSAIVDPAQVEEMFYQIPDILLCHEFFLEQLQTRVNDWHDRQKIGDIFVASVSG